ncbi:hypothetical protein HHL16_12695 [Pseudoflavitalea sp. G-6-1-2]|uniref:hypothetical protein n=1 Tax=Pseudoflavitalea sp. G-6-1-2 TaxID=2728841 RepID=UPI00146CDB40|nr:hypothetical protein [Pseudoflavitalea sp. G-6-1-2]NML21741.1 hypothetical protein [Pseudoflavitalea sp. G-6-1-2]
MILAGKIKFTGRFGDLISYKRNGKYCLRSVPEHVTQTDATRKAAKRFGEASHTGKLIRHALAPYLYGKKDQQHVNRLNKRLIESGVEGLRGYRFNQKRNVSEFLYFPTFGDDNILRILNIIEPRHMRVTHMEYKLIAMRLDTVTGEVLQLLERSYTHKFVSWAENFKPVELDANLPGKGTLIVVLQANPYQGKYPLYDKRFHATEIIKVEVPATKTISGKQRRKQQKKLQTKQQLAQHWQHFTDEGLQQVASEIIAGTGNSENCNNRLKEQRE